MIKTKFKGDYIKDGITKSFKQINKTIFIHKQFCLMLFYLILKIFKKYSKLK